MRCASVWFGGWIDTSLYGYPMSRFSVDTWKYTKCVLLDKVMLHCNREQLVYHGFWGDPRSLIYTGLYRRNGHLLPWPHGGGIADDAKCPYFASPPRSAAAQARCLRRDTFDGWATPRVRLKRLRITLCDCLLFTPTFLDFCQGPVGKGPETDGVDGEKPVLFKHIVVEDASAQQTPRICLWCYFIGRPMA